MRFQRNPLRYEKRPLTARRLNAARQANAMPLFADQIRASQPTPEERIAKQDEAFRQFCQAQRDYDAQSWRRAVLRRLAPR